MHRHQPGHAVIVTCLLCLPGGVRGPDRGCSMGLPVRERRVLEHIESTLRGSDPKLAAIYAMFARLNQDEEMPRIEQLRHSVLVVLIRIRLALASMTSRLHFRIIPRQPCHLVLPARDRAHRGGDRVRRPLQLWQLLHAGPDNRRRERRQAEGMQDIHREPDVLRPLVSSELLAPPRLDADCCELGSLAAWRGIRRQRPAPPERTSPAAPCHYPGSRYRQGQTGQRRNAARAATSTTRRSAAS